MNGDSYTLTYTPSQDRIVPTAPHLALKIRNTSAVALRAAYLHGPYTLYTACWPSVFDPNEPRGSPEVFGHPDFEPNLKAGGSWTARLKVPEEIRETFVGTDKKRQPAEAGGSATWVIEISSQVLFSLGAAVHFELLIGRDDKSVDLGMLGTGVVSSKAPGNLGEFQDRRKEPRIDQPQQKGVFSKAVGLAISDTAALWNVPQLPGQSQERKDRDDIRTNPTLSQGDPTSNKDHEEMTEAEAERLEAPRRKKREDRQKIHLVLITHGLHSNLGADMLYLKESIDASARQARLDRTMRKAKRRAERKAEETARQDPSGSSSAEDKTEVEDDGEESDDDEQVVVRGFPGNAIKTERGIQYLGKRLAKYVLTMTYPDQPYVYVKKRSMTRSLTNALGGSEKHLPAGGSKSHSQETHHHSTIRKQPVEGTNLAYQITSISFIGHSLGGLVQTYAIAYIQKHSPEFFTLIKPVNFVALASPFLGLSNENPLYVKFALDFGLVGRTGQDLGLTWRAPTMVRSGWGAMIAGIGTDGKRRRTQMQPSSKPLLRILPAGPAHQALRLFRNRTVYSNVVNDGIVPLRTSCLLFLDWRGLDRVDKARRDNGLVGTMAGWGWAEITGQNSTNQIQIPSWRKWWSETDDEDNMDQDKADSSGAVVPQPDDEDVADHTNVSAPSSPVEESHASMRKRTREDEHALKHTRSNSDSGPSPFAGFLAMLKSGGGSHHKNKHAPQDPKSTRIYSRSQTVRFDEGGSPVDSPVSTPDARSPSRPGMARGESVLQDENVFAPPKTSIFESAGDLMNPPLPSKEYLSDPKSRQRTIFHDRVYHPEDIPPPPLARPRSFLRRTPSYDTRMESNLSPSSATNAEGNTAGTSSGELQSPVSRPSTSSPSRKPSWMSRSTSTDKSTVDPPNPNTDTSKSSTSTSLSLNTNNLSSPSSSTSVASSSANMKVEEKIARAYHRDLSWRKVLVRLEPDAHNNIVVRRMFANAYGWPVIKHLCDTHFADSATARLPDNQEAGLERAKPMDAQPGETEVIESTRRPSNASVTTARGTGAGGSTTGIGSGKATRSSSLGMASLGLGPGRVGSLKNTKDQTNQNSEELDNVTPLPDMDSMTASQHSGTSSRRTLSRVDSAQWDDRFFDSDEDDDDDETEDDDAAFESRRSPRGIAMEGRRAVQFIKGAAGELSGGGSGSKKETLRPRPKDVEQEEQPRRQNEVEGQTGPMSKVKLTGKAAVAAPNLDAATASPPRSSGGGGSVGEGGSNLAALGLRKSLDDVMRVETGSPAKKAEE